MDALILLRYIILSPVAAKLYCRRMVTTCDTDVAGGVLQSRHLEMMIICRRSSHRIASKSPLDVAVATLNCTIDAARCPAIEHLRHQGHPV